MDSVWRFANNVDPKRDSILIEATDADPNSHLAFDGKKTKELDDFQRLAKYPFRYCNHRKN